MGPRQRLGDRREQVRFDVAGQLWASLEVNADVVVRNMSVGGALVEAKLAPGLRTVRSAQMAVPERGSALNAMVRHMTPLSADPAEDRYLIGLQFVNPSSVVLADVERLVRDWGEHAGAGN